MDTNSQKLDDTLALALSVGDVGGLVESSLFDGYSAEDETWELIVKYSGSLDRLQADNVRVEELLAGYAVVTLPGRLVNAFAGLPEIEYIEQPKRLVPQIMEGLSASCFLPVLRAPQGGLSGEGVLLAVIDSGIDYTLENFRNADGSSRIAWIYDQTNGVEYGMDAINESLQSYDRSRRDRTPFTRLTEDVTGHGTKVAAIAGSGAPGAHFLIVKLDTANQSSYPLTSNLMRAFTYVVKKAQQIGMPVAINLSYGNTYGSHEGTSLLERFIDNASEVGRNVICVGMGNEGASAGHYTGNLRNVAAGSALQVSFAVGNYQGNLSLQVWTYPADRYEALIISPSGQRYLIQSSRGDGESQTAQLESTRLYIYSGTAKPYRTKEELYISFEPVGDYVNTGVWQLELTPVDVKNGVVQMYLPAESIRSSSTRFLNPDPYGTVTIPATASKVISVGAYRSGYDAYAPFSGRGNYGMDAEELWQIPKPDLAAPGVGIEVPGRYGAETVSGTSYATPYVTAAAALLMEWGIVRGNDPYLYGEKVKAYLQQGAAVLQEGEILPSSLTGWGALCVYNSIPKV